MYDRDRKNAGERDTTREKERESKRDRVTERQISERGDTGRIERNSVMN